LQFDLEDKMATKLGSNKQQADQQELDPKYEWQENAANFLLKLHLSGTFFFLSFACKFIISS
jgi:hypothetical protein